jgi:predicted kinase
MPAILVISGAPASGKTTLALRMRSELGWPLLAKDAIKESLFDALGWSDRAWSKRVSGASYALMFGLARELIDAGNSCVLEANFRWVETQHHFASIAAGRDIRYVQAFCTADAERLVSRMKARIAANERHPGHVDAAAAAELEGELRNRPLQPLPLGEQPLVYDSSRDRLDEVVARLAARCRASCGK